MSAATLVESEKLLQQAIEPLEPSGAKIASS